MKKQKGTQDSIYENEIPPNKDTRNTKNLFTGYTNKWKYINKTLQIAHQRSKSPKCTILGFQKASSSISIIKNCKLILLFTLCFY